MTADRHHKARLAVTMGDPAGIGPELCIRLLHKTERDATAEQVPIIFGDATILKKVSERIGVPLFLPSYLRQRTSRDRLLFIAQQTV